MLWWRGEHSLRRDSPRPPRRSGPGRPAAGTGPQGPLRREPPRDHAGDRPAGAFRPRPDRGGRAATDAGQSPPQGPTRHRSGRGHRPRTQQRLRDVLRRPGGTGTPARRPGRRRTTSRRSRRKGVETMSTTRPDQIHHAVREHYAAAARAATDPAPAAPVVDAIGAGQYDQQAAQSLPEAALAASLGCGNPTALADLHPGETVLDLGSGAGIDVLLSARRVGPTGKAYGLDFTPEMLDLARRNQHEAGITNAEFLHGTIEDIPLPDASVDVIISNCVIDRADITRIADDPAIAGAIPPDIDPEATITALDGAVTSAFVRARKPGP